MSAAGTFARAVASIDFSASNARISELKAELANVDSRDAEVRAEIDRLSGEIANWRAPEPKAVAAAILAGTGLAEAASSTASFKTSPKGGTRSEALYGL